MVLPFLRDRTAVALLAVLTLPALPAQAQTLYGTNSQGGAGLPLAVESVGPAGGPCAYPNGPFGAPAFPAGVGAAGCPSPSPYAGFPGRRGDIAVDHENDTIWVAGPNAVGEYLTDGTGVSGFANPIGGQLTGLGYDTFNDWIWLTNGPIYAAVAPACAGAAVVAGPWASPIGDLTDIAWDPASGTLWACNDTGNVANFPAGGAPTCFFTVVNLGLNPLLTGLAVDITTPNPAMPANTTVFVTDGTVIAKVNTQLSCPAAMGVLEAPTLPFPNGIWPVAGGPIDGLAFAAHGATFGAGTGPEIAYKGQSIQGLVGPTLSLDGAMPGMAGLFVDFGALCPVGVFMGLPLHVFPTLIIGPIGHAGTVTLPAGIPSTAPIGVPVTLQWFSTDGAGLWESTPGLVVTTARL